MQIKKTLRTNKDTRKATRRFPTLYLMQEGEATAKDINALATTLQNIVDSALTKGEDCPLYQNLVNNEAEVFRLKAISPEDREDIQRQLDTYSALYEYVFMVGEAPYPSQGNRHDFLAAKYLLRAELPKLTPLAISNDDEEIERLLSMSEAVWATKTQHGPCLLIHPR